MALNIKLPVEVRNEVRKHIRAHVDFEAFRIETGNWASRDLDQTRTMAAIERFQMEDYVKGLLANWETSGLPEGAGKSVSALETTLADGGDAAESMFDAVLEPLRPFLGQTLLETVADRLAPIVTLALKPAVEKIVEVEKTVEKVRTVTLGADGAPVDTFPVASQTGVSTLGKVFGLSRSKHSGLPVGLWDSAEAPPADPCFVTDVSLMARLAFAIEGQMNVWLAGPAGSGKSTMPLMYAAHTGRGFCEIAFQRAIEPVDLIGSKELDGKGGMVWRDGVLTRAIRRPGTVILLDEITMAPAGLLAVLQALMSSRVMTLPTGERVSCAQGVVFVAADNTRGYGDETGLYAGTMSANAALVDRAAIMLAVDYLPANLESQALANHTGAPRAACDRVVSWINSARKLSGFEARPLSLRRMMAFVRMAAKGFTPREALEDTMLSRLPDAEREAFRAHFIASFVEADFVREMSGAPVPVASVQSDAPEQVKARSSFDSVE